MPEVTEAQLDAALFSPYAPIRYRPTVWWQYARDAARAEYVTPLGELEAGLHGWIDTQLINPFIERWIQKVKGTKDEKSSVLYVAKVNLLHQWVPLAAQFEACGRQIYDLSDGLVEMLKNTDVSECTLEDWNPPYGAFFLYFGRQDEARQEFVDSRGNYEYLDGAFVGVTYSNSAAPGEADRLERWVRFGFTTVRENGEGMSSPGYYLDILGDMLNMPIPQAIEAALEFTKKQLMASAEHDNVSQAIVRSRCALFDEAAGLFRAAIPLVINTLFYIESQPLSGVRAPGRDVPAELVKKWEASTPRQRQKLASRLTSEGYTVVQLIGSELSSDMHGSAQASGALLRTHWRRGHWRQQAYGPQMSLRKRTWVKPVMVNADRPHDDLPGRIYKVQNNRSD